MQCVGNCDAPLKKDRHLFEQPVLQTLQMFIGESGCWLVIGLFSAYERYASRRAGYEAVSEADGENAEGVVTPTLSDESDTTAVSNPLKPAHADDEGRIPLEGWNVFLLALPACCDIAGTTLMNVGLLFVAASIYQMTRGALVLFVGLFSVWFLKRHLGLYKWFSLFIVVFGVAIVGLAGAITRDDKASHSSVSSFASGGEEQIMTAPSQAVMTVIGVLLIAGAQIFTATQFVLEERIMEKYSMEPIRVVGWEGVFGFLVTLIVMIVLHFAVGTGYFNAREGFYQMTHYPAIAVSSLLIMISIGYVASRSRMHGNISNKETIAASTSSDSVSRVQSPLHRARPSIPAAHSSYGSSRWDLAGKLSSGCRFWVSRFSSMERSSSTTWSGPHSRHVCRVRERRKGSLCYQRTRLSICRKRQEEEAGNTILASLFNCKE